MFIEKAAYNMVLAKAGGLCGIDYQVRPAFANTFPLAANCIHHNCKGID
jgi:hypothetical protein